MKERKNEDEGGRDRDIRDVREEGGKERESSHTREKRKSEKRENGNSGEMERKLGAEVWKKGIEEARKRESA